MTIQLEETSKIQLSTTFRYSIDVFGRDISSEEERRLDIGDYISESKESMTQGLELSLVIANTCKDLTKVLNNEVIVTKVIVYRKDEQDNVILKSEYDINNLFDWDTFAASEEKGTSKVELVIQKYDSWEKELANFSTPGRTKIIGKIRSEDADIGNQVTKVNLKFAVSNYKHTNVMEV